MARAAAASPHYVIPPLMRSPIYLSTALVSLPFKRQLRGIREKTLTASCPCRKMGAALGLLDSAFLKGRMLDTKCTFIKEQTPQDYAKQQGQARRYPSTQVQVSPHDLTQRQLRISSDNSQRFIFAIM